MDVKQKKREQVQINSAIKYRMIVAAYYWQLHRNDDAAIIENKMLQRKAP
jgi:hypothetical protein